MRPGENPELYKECEGLLLSIDECGINECLQDNFGFDICNPVMYKNVYTNCEASYTQ